MKKLIFLVLIFAASIVQAGNGGLYLGAGVGSTEISSAITQAELDPVFETTIDIDSNESGSQFFVGWRFANNWSIEVGSVDLGNGYSDNLYFVEEGAGPPIGLDLDVDGTYYNAQYHFQASETTSIDITIGAIDADLEFSAISCCGVLGAGEVLNTAEESESGLMAGIGATLDLSDQLALRANLNYYDVNFSSEEAEVNKFIDSPYRIGVDLIWDF
ncbi:MAG: outer membrane beta-barrel protein [Pseudomonadota bacterium]|nr:outer membrane beta-barrel protein [Pseudomonadota bacterium]